MLIVVIIPAIITTLTIVVIAPPERQRATNAYLADLFGCGLRSTNHIFEVFRGPKILRLPRIAFFIQRNGSAREINVHPLSTPQQPRPDHNIML